MFRIFTVFLMMLYLVCVPLGNKALAEGTDDGMFRILVLGDSLVSGYNIKKEEAYPAVLEAFFRSYKYPVSVINGGQSGDTALAGLKRLPYHLKQKPHLVIIALGANDALKGIAPGITYDSLERIIKSLKDRHIQAVLMGMKAPYNMGSTFGTPYNNIFPNLAQKYSIPLYPFFLDGVAMQPEYNLSDGVHPNPAGVEIMVRKSAPFLMRIVYQMMQQMYPPQQQATPEQTKNAAPAE